MDDVLMANDLTRYGLRRVHVMRMGARPERERWLALAPGEVDLDDMSVIETREDGLDVWHLHVCWHARELVKLEGGEQGMAVMWYLGGQPVRLGVDCAATLFNMRTGRLPRAALIGKLPRGTVAGVMVAVSPAGEIPLREAGWAPKGFVVVVDGGEA